jgi:hypothetical protein
MTSTLFITFQTPASREWFDQLQDAMYSGGSHSGSSTTTVGGPNGPVFEPKCTFVFFDHDKAVAAADVAKTYPFVVSAEAKLPPAKFARGKRYVRRRIFADYDKTEFFVVKDRSREFVTLLDEGNGLQPRFKIKRDDDGNEYVDGKKQSACPAWPTFRIFAKNVEQS